MSAKPHSIKPPLCKGGKSPKATGGLSGIHSIYRCSKMEGNSPSVGYADSSPKQGKPKGHKAPLSRELPFQGNWYALLCGCHRRQRGRTKSIQTLRKVDSQSKPLQGLQWCWSQAVHGQTESLYNTNAIAKRMPQLRPYGWQHDPRAHFWCTPEATYPFPQRRKSTNHIPSFFLQ